MDKRKLLIIVLLLFAFPAHAQTVANPSFEAAATLDQSFSGGSYNLGPIPSWTISGGTAGLWQPAASEFTSLPDGAVIAYSNGGNISQDVGPVSASATYTFSVWVGRRADQWEVPTNSYTVSLSAGATVLCTQSAQLNTIPVGTFTKQALSCPAGSATGDVTISLGCNGPQCAFDNVTLTSGPLPPFVFPYPGFGTFTFPMAAPPDCSDGTCSLVACNITTNVCVTLLPGQSGNVVIWKSSNNWVVVAAP